MHARLRLPTRCCSGSPEPLVSVKVTASSPWRQLRLVQCRIDDLVPYLIGDAAPDPVRPAPAVLQGIDADGDIAIIPAIEGRARSAEFMQSAPRRQVRVLDQTDDRQLLGCGGISFVVASIRDHAENPQFQCLLGDNLPEIARLLAQQRRGSRGFGFRLSTLRTRPTREPALPPHESPLTSGAILERFQEKWKPVFRPEVRKNNDLERARDSVKRGHALVTPRAVRTPACPTRRRSVCEILCGGSGRR